MLWFRGFIPTAVEVLRISPYRRMIAALPLAVVLLALPSVGHAAASASWLVQQIRPWDFSPTVLLCTLLALGIYINGLRVRRRRGLRNGFWLPLAYCVGVIAIYLVLQTRVDYYSQHMFYIHRLQHLVLHHLGPFLIALAVPQAILRAGIPGRLWQRAVAPVLRSAPVRVVCNLLLDPILAPLLFVAGIAFWLIPVVHYDAMLSLPLYNLMNWSMVIDGLPFWWLVLNPEPKPPARVGYGARILMLVLVMFPQILIGSFIGLSTHDLFDVYAVCGRLYPISAVTDQQIGGLIIWIPGSMMSVIGMLIVLTRYRRQRDLGRAGR